MSRAWLEVRIPISPVDHYFNKIHFIAHSIRSLGRRFQNIPIRVTVGAEQSCQDLYNQLPWSHALGIEWHWITDADFAAWKGTANPYIATMMERFRPPFAAENVLMLDSDVVALRPFDALLKLLDNGPRVSGIMAHVTPFKSDDKTYHTEMWRRLYHLAGIGQPRFEFALTGWGLMDMEPSRRFSPPYFNTGVLLASAATLEKLYEPYMDALALVRKTIDTYFFEQIALTLALLKSRIPYMVLPMRYNFPNDPRFDNAYGQELNEIRFLHFLRTEIVQRDADFKTGTAVAALIGRSDLTGSNELYRRRIAELAPLVFASELAS